MVAASAATAAVAACRCGSDSRALKMVTGMGVCAGEVATGDGSFAGGRRMLSLGTNRRLRSVGCKDSTARGGSAEGGSSTVAMLEVGICTHVAGGDATV